MKGKKRVILLALLFALFISGTALRQAGKIPDNVYQTDNQGYDDKRADNSIRSEEKTAAEVQSVAFREKRKTGEISTDYAEKVEKNELEIIQAESLTLLEAYKGEYDETSIVLEGTSKERAKQIADDIGAKLRITDDGLYAQLTLPKGVNIADVFEDDDNLTYIKEMSPDWIAYPADVEETTEEGTEDEGLGEKSSDLKKESKSSFKDPLYSKQTYYNYMNVGDVLSETYDKKIKVAIIDSGIEISHPEFEGIISDRSYNASTDEVVADYGMDVIQDCMGHGTVCAGSLAAKYNNNKGIVGAANNVELVVIKCETNPDKTFKRASDINFGLAYAIEQNVDVVSMSIGGGGPVNPYATYCQLAVDSDITVVASAGNDTTSTPSWPAADPNVIGVGALEYDSWDIAWYSNFGDNSDIVAPGRVLTTESGGGNKYTMVHGTSLATPIVAGIVARFYATHENVTYGMIKELLEASAMDLGDPGEDWIYGYGALDVDTFINGEIGKVTFDYMTDEIKNTEQLFYRNHILQNFPEPERENVVFAGWFLDEQCTEPFDNLTTPMTEDVTLYAAWENEDEGVPFDYVEVEGGIEITAYYGKRRYTTVPSEIDGKTVVGIGSQAFSNNSKLVQVDLPDTLKYIGYLAFSGCNKLSKIDIPDSVVTIDNGAFSGCSLLTQVNISEESLMERIGDSAFENCGSLRSFYLGRYVNSVSGDSFAGTTGMNEIRLNDNNENYVLKDGTLYSHDYLWAVYRPAKIRTIIDIDSGTRYIGNSAFNYSKANEVNIPKGVEYIGRNAFASSSVVNVSLPSSVTEIGKSSFMACSLLNSFDFGHSGITVIPDQAFKYCSSLNSITIPASVVSIGSDKTGETFEGCGLTEIIWEEGCSVSEIKPNSFLSNPINSIVIPKSVETIGLGAFELCWNLSDVTFEEGCKIDSIYPMVFWCCYSLEHIELPDTVQTIYHDAFAYSGLQSIHIPKKLNKIEEAAFKECNNFAEITVDNTNNNFMAEDNVLYNKGKTVLVLYPCARQGDEFSIPDGVTGIAQYAFYGAVNLKTVVLPETISKLDGYAFSHCRSMENVNLPDTLVTIGLNAFEYCISLKEFDIPASVKTIGRYAFYCCSVMENIRVAHDAELVRIGYAAFAYTGIRTFSMPATVSSMGQLVFSGCSNLQTVSFESGSKLTSISAWLFDGAEALKEIEFGIDSKLQYVSARAFERLKALRRIDLSNCTSLEKVGNYAFSACTKLTEVVLPDNLAEIGRYAFHNCRALNMLNIPTGVNEIGSYAFAYTNEIELFFAGTELPKILDTNWNYGVKGYYLGASDKTVSGDWIYVLHEDGTVSVCGYRGNDTQIDLDEIDGHKVSSIGFAAFRNSSIESIVLNDGITSIGDFAFAGTTNLKSLNVPAECTYIGSNAFDGSALCSLTFADNSSLTRIADNAFAGTDNLGDIVLPASLQTIGRYAFYKSGIDSLAFEEGATLDTIESFVFADSGIERIELPNMLQKIDDHAFYNTSKLESIDFGNPEKLSIRSNAFYGSGIKNVTIPEGVVYIGEFAFDSCVNMTEVVVGEENAWYSSKDGVLYNKDKTSLITYPAGRAEGVIIPATVRTIKFGAFENAKVTDVVFEEGSNLATIGYRAFYQCTGLSEVIVPDSLLSFDSYAFAGCTSLETVDISSAKNLSGIYKAAFYGCKNLKDFVIPDTVREIGDYVFYDCKSAISAIGADSKLIAIGDYAFAHAGITDFTAGDNMLSIGYAAFQNSSLKHINLGAAPLVFIGGYAFDGAPVNDEVLVIPDTVSEIGYKAFGGIHTVKSLTMPIPAVTDEGQEYNVSYLFGSDSSKLVIEEASITAGTSIPEKMFSNVYSLKKVTLSDEITSLGNQALYNTGITFIDIPDGVEYIGDWCFYRCYGLTSIDLPDSLVKLGSAFEECENLAGTIRIPKNTKHIESSFISQTSVERIEVDIDNQYYSAMDGILYSKTMDKLLVCPAGYVGSVCMPDDVLEIGSYAFSNCKNVTDVTLSDTIRIIGQKAFAYSGIKELSIPSSIVSVNDRFIAWSEIETVIFKENSNITVFPWYSFGEASKLKKVVLPDSLKRIESQNFQSCGLLEEIVIPEGVEYLGDEAFRGCSSLKKLSLPASVKSIGDGVIAGCVSLTDFSIHEDNKDYVVCNNMLLDAAMTKVYCGMPGYEGKVEVPRGVESIGKSAFAECLLTEIVIPDTVTTIGKEAFEKASQLKKVNMPDSLRYIGYWAFYDTPVLSESYDNNGVAYIGKYLVDYNGSGSEVDVREDTIGIADYAFRYRSVVKKVNFPDNLRFIGYCAFYTCSIDTLYLPNSLEYIYHDAFANINELKQVVFEDGFNADMWVEEYGSWFGSGPFDGNRNIETIVIPQSMMNHSGNNVLSLGVEALGELGYTFDWSTYRFNWQDGIKIIIKDSTEPSDDIDVAGVTGAMIYTYEDEEASLWHKGWGDNNKVYYLGQWNLATYNVNNTPVWIDTMKKGAVVQPPSSELVKAELSDTCNFKWSGWDLNCDGAADTLPTTLLEDMTAEAVYSVHDWINPITEDATCTSDGKIKYTCSLCDKNKEEIIEAYGHDYVEVTTVEPTETEDGYTTYECSRCHDVYDGDFTIATGDTLSDWTVIEEATCTMAGTEGRFSNQGGHLIETRNIPPKGHTEGDWIIVEPAECEKDGLKIMRCSVCNEILKRQVIEAPGHQYGDWVITKEATYEYAGERNRTCKVCNFVEYGTIAKLEKIEANEVQFKESNITMFVDEYKKLEVSFDPIDVTETNLTWESSDANIAEVDIYGTVHAKTPGIVTITATTDNDISASCNITVEPLACQHKLVHIQSSEADCVNMGNIEYWYCETCKKYFSDAEGTTEITLADTVIEAKGHDYGEWETVKSPTCEDTGSKKRTCKTCGHIDTAGVDATGHDWNTEYTVDKEATCTTEGSKSIHCKNCDAVKDSEVIPAKGHTEVTDPAVSATCTETGLTEGKHCSVCNEVLVVQEIILATGHSMTVTMAKDATCTEAGKTAYLYCNTCKKYFSDEAGTTEIKLADTIINANGHDYGEWETVKSPSCEDAGSKKRTCKTCGHVDTQGLDATGHEWNSDFTVDKEATCTTEGSKSIHCKNCDAVKDSEVIPAKGHTEVTDPAVASTCTETGLTEGNHCSVCNEVLVAQEIVHASGHKYGEWETVKSPTCEDTGSKQRTCKICGHIDTAGVDAAGHDWSPDYTIDKEATCTTEGSKSIHCKRCGAVKDSQTISLLEKQEQIITVSKKASKTVTYKAKVLRKKKASFNISAKAKGAISYKVTKGAKHISVSKKGKVIINKKAKKGTYKILITAAKTDEYKQTKRYVVIKIE